MQILDYYMNPNTNSYEVYWINEENFFHFLIEKKKLK
jgi:hypothetical protein